MKEYDYDFPKFPKFTLLPWLLWALVVGLVIAGVLYASKVASEEVPVHVFEDKGVLIRMMPGPCVDGVSALVISMNVPPQFSSKFRAIESEWPMQDGSRRAFAGCWASFKAEEIGSTEDVLVLVFEDRQYFVVPKKEFLKTPGQGA